MDVLDHEEHSVVLGRDRQQADDRLEQPQLRLLRVARLRGGVSIRQLWEQLGELAAGGAESRPNLVLPVSR